MLVEWAELQGNNGSGWLEGSVQAARARVEVHGGLEWVGFLVGVV